MPSLNTPAPENLRTRVLSATLAEVRARRQTRQRTFASAAALFLVAAVATWTLTRPDVSPTKYPNITIQNPPEAPAPPIFPAIAVERIAESPLQNIRRISTSTPSSIARIPQDPTVHTRFISLTDDQLLAALPAEQPVALVHIPGGTSRLVVLP